MKIKIAYGIIAFVFASFSLFLATNHTQAFSTNLTCLQINANNPKNCPSPSPVCGKGEHLGNPHCSPKPTATPTPKPTVSPTPTPSVSPKPTPCVIWEKEFPIPCPSVTPTPSESASPSATPAPSNTPVFVQDNSAPSCGDSTLTSDAKNVLVWRKGDQAIVQWWPTGGTQVDILYKQVGQPNWQYSKLDQANNGYNVISGLGKLNITFAVMQKNGCGGGIVDDAVTVVDDASALGWHLFTAITK